MKIDVLDHGYVRLLNHMGTDLDPVNDAKVSFDKSSLSFEEKEARLLAFLVREEHTSVFRHSVLKFEVYAPLMVARQWFKYAVASSHLEDQFGWNESSRRYITEEPTFYIPAKDEWRSAPENKKQGSGASVHWEIGEYTSDILQMYINQGIRLYNRAIEQGIAPEQARLFLPAYGMYVRWRWTASLGAILHFLNQRLADDAQVEIQLYAQAVRDLTAHAFPASVEALL